MTEIATAELLGRELNDVEAKYAPRILHVKGDTQLLSPNSVRVSIVGSRRASENGLRRAQKLARQLVAEDIVYSVHSVQTR